MTAIPLSKPMTPDLARAIYAVLVAACDVPISGVDDFVKRITQWNGAQWNLDDWEKSKVIADFRFVWRSDGIGIVPGDIREMDEHDAAEAYSAIDRTMRALAVLMEGK
jgi:hypothetical protein